MIVGLLSKNTLSIGISHFGEAQSKTMKTYAQNEHYLYQQIAHPEAILCWMTS